MTQLQQRCPKCSKDMERGHIPDVAPFVARQSSWAPGEPHIRGGALKVEYDRIVPLTAHRCVGCGYVELYALPG